MNIMNQKHFVANNVLRCFRCRRRHHHISLAIFYFQSDFILFVNIIMHWLIHKANLNADKNVFRWCMYVRKELYRNHRKIRSITTTTNNSIHENFTMNRFVLCVPVSPTIGIVNTFLSHTKHWRRLRFHLFVVIYTRWMCVCIKSKLDGARGRDGANEWAWACMLCLVFVIRNRQYIKWVNQRKIVGGVYVMLWYAKRRQQIWNYENWQRANIRTNRKNTQHTHTIPLCTAHFWLPLFLCLKWAFDFCSLIFSLVCLFSSSFFICSRFFFVLFCLVESSVHAVTAE